jgi:hypothetical protein
MSGPPPTSRFEKTTLLGPHFPDQMSVQMLRVAPDVGPLLELVRRYEPYVGPLVGPDVGPRPSDLTNCRMRKNVSVLTSCVHRVSVEKQNENPWTLSYLFLKESGKKLK